MRRNVRANARLEVARSKHETRRQVYTPRPGAFVPGTSSPLEATNRSSSACGAFRPQPAHVRIAITASPELRRRLLLAVLWNLVRLLFGDRGDRSELLDLGVVRDLHRFYLFLGHLWPGGLGLRELLVRRNAAVP